MRTLLISDLHLGSRMGRDVLRHPAALARLCEAVADVERLVLLGDTVEMLEGRPKSAMAAAEPVLRALGAALGPGGSVILLPGNHDHALVRPWLRERRTAGRALETAGRVPVRSSPELQAIARWLKPASVEVRYPWVDLGDGIWAHHGHYLDRHLVRQPIGRAPRTPGEYERAPGASIIAAGAIIATSLPPAIGHPVRRVVGALRRADVVSRPIAASLPGARWLAPVNAAALSFQFRHVGLPAMASMSERLAPGARDVIFGHLHRAGPLERDGDAWWVRGGQRFWNTGSWVHEPLLVAGSTPPRPYWPGGSVLIEDGVITTRGLLDDLGLDRLAGG